MKFRRFRRAAAAILLPAFLLTGCWQDTADTNEALNPDPSAAVSSQEESGAPVLPSSLSLPYDAAETLDPITCPDGVQQTVAALLYEGLYELDTSLQPQGRLCTAASYDPAALTWTFTLRSGVAFTDGSPLTAADAAASLQRARSSPRYASRLECISSFTAGDGTVTAVLNRANTALPSLLDIPIVKSGTEDQPVPVGTGPYSLVSDESGVYLTANTAWWNGSVQPVRRIGLVNCTDQDSVRFQFTSHAVQLITSDLTGTDPISATGKFEFYDADTTVLQYLGFNLSRPLFADTALRQAMSLGVDRDTVVSACLSSHARAAQFPVSPVSGEYPDSLASDYSYSAFESAMTEAGYHAGATRSATLLVNSENSFKVSAAKYLASALSAFDLDITVESLPWEEYKAALAAGNYDLYYAEVKLTADGDLRPLIGTGGSLNYGGYSNATLDLLLNEYASADDRAAAMQAVCSYLAKQVPIIPICFKCTSVLAQEGVVDNLTPTAANPFYDIATCSIHLAG